MNFQAKATYVYVYMCLHNIKVIANMAILFANVCIYMTDVPTVCAGHTLYN